MNDHRVTYSISHLPGCASAPLQAVDTADRRPCAVIAAWASFLAGKPIRGTLAGADHAEVNAWFESELRDMQIPWARARTWADALNGRRIVIPPADEQYPIDGLIPDAYQFLAMRHCTVAGGGMALGVGLGKTLTASWLARHISGTSCQPNRCWITGPLAAAGAWERFLPELRKHYDDVRVLSVDSAHKLVGADNALGGLLIADEAHEVGHGSARRTKAMHELRRKFDFCIALTGTLTHAGVEPVASVLDLIVPGGAAFANKWKLGDHFRCLDKGQFGVKLRKPPEDAKESFMAWMSRLVIHLTKKSPEVRECLTIPDQHVYDVPIDEPWPKLGDEVARIIEEIFAETGELPHMAEVSHRICRLGKEAKVDWVLGMVEGDDATPVVVFAQYRETLDYLQARLEEADRTFVRVDGDTPKEQRPEIRRRFQAGEVQFYIGQTKAGGISMDLDRATVSVSLDHSWKAIEYAQSLGRTDRRTQTHETHHFDLYANRLQREIIQRVRAEQDFAAECDEWQAVKRMADAAKYRLNTNPS